MYPYQSFAGRSPALWGAASFFVLSFAAFLFSLPPRSVDANGASYPSALVAPTSNATPLEVHIANNGLVLLRSARVISVEGNTITVSTSWGQTDLVWVVRTNAQRYETRTFGTHFLTRNGGVSSLEHIHAGSSVTITGTLDNSSNTLTLNANSVRSLE